MPKARDREQLGHALEQTDHDRLKVCEHVHTPGGRSDGGRTLPGAHPARQIAAGEHCVQIPDPRRWRFVGVAVLGVAAAQSDDVLVTRTSDAAW